MKTIIPYNPLPKKTFENNNQEIWKTEIEIAYEFLVGVNSMLQYYNT